MLALICVLCAEQLMLILFLVTLVKVHHVISSSSEKPVESWSYFVCECRLILISSDLEALMRSLNIGREDEHDHHHDEHASDDDSSSRLRKRSGHERQTRHDINTTWDQVSQYRLNTDSLH